MPPAAAVAPVMLDQSPTSPTSTAVAFDIGVIEVQALEGKAAKRFATRILMAPGTVSTSNSTHGGGASRHRMSAASSVPTSPVGGVHQYGASLSSSLPSSPLSYAGGGNSNLGMAESFDSTTDEIVEGSNEANLFKRIVERRATDYQDHLDRADSFSDTNSVNSNEPFVIDMSQEMEYFDVLDRQLVETNPERTEFGQLDTNMDGSHPNKRHVHLSTPTVEDIFDHLCAGPCGECNVADAASNFGSSILVVDGSAMPQRLRPVLRKSCRWSSNNSSNCNNNNSGMSSWLEDATRTMERDDYEEDNDNSLLFGGSSYFCGGGVPSTRASRRRPRSVQFKDVDIREFKMTLGNHPSATSGPPVMLSGELHSPRKVMTLEQYEQTRPPRRKRRQLKLSLQQRHNVLVKEQGFSFEEVKGAWQEALEIRKRRKETLERGYVCSTVRVHDMLAVTFYVEVKSPSHVIIYFHHLFLLLLSLPPRLALMKWDEVWESTCRKFSRLVDGSI